MSRNKWQLHRAGIFNFWYYDDEELDFAGGKLLLRGSNGSGKSVTMQSLIPLLLDGRKSPDRLDPFGSRARRIEDYLLGEKGVVDRDERTGYLYLEYKRQRTDQYLTTGIGLRAKRESNLEFWGFLILDNRRIGRDLTLYKTEYSLQDGKEQKIPLVRRELEHRLGPGGRVVRTQKEYVELVNKHIFGFESLDAFEDLIKLLIQLRSPKLSKDFKPTIIYEILNDSLPGLSDDELRPLSETIENMDQTKQQLDQLLRDQRSLKRLCRQYDVYNRFVRWEKAEGYLRAHRRGERLESRERELRRLLEQHREDRARFSAEWERLKREQTVLKEEEAALREHDVFKAEAEKVQVERTIAALQESIRAKTKGLEQKRRTEVRLRREIDAEENKTTEAETVMKGLLERLTAEADQALFAGHHVAAAEFRKKYAEEFTFDLWRLETGEYLARLDGVLKVLKEQTRAREKYEDADRDRAEAQRLLDRAEHEASRAGVFFDEERDRYLGAFHAWVKQNRELLLSEDEIRRTSERALQMFEPYRLEEVREPAAEAYHRHSERLREELADLGQQIRQKERAILEKNRELDDWKKKKDPEPERHPDTEAARAGLDAAGIPYLPFFAAVEFREGITEEMRERIEAAITQMGLLDALIVPERFLARVDRYDRVLEPAPQFFAHTLADFLVPAPAENSAVTVQDIDNVLRSVLIDDTGEHQARALVREDGRYRMALLKGHAPRQDRSIYIGRETRRRYRREVINGLKAELETLEEERAALQQAERQLQGRLRRLREEYQSFPADADVAEAHRMREEARQQVKLRGREVQKKDELLKKAMERLQDVRAQLRGLTEGLALPGTEEAYDTALRHMRGYRDYLHKLELIHKDFANCRSRIVHYRLSLDEAVADAGVLQGELAAFSGELDTNKLRLVQIARRLEELGADEIRARIEDVLRRLAGLPEAIDAAKTKIMEAEHKIESTGKEIRDTLGKRETARFLQGLWKRTFLDDLKLGLPGSVEVGADPVDDEVAGIARAILRQDGPASGEQLDRAKVTDRLNEAFYREQAVLVEYRPAQETVLALEDSAVREVEQGDEEPAVLLDELRQKARRVQLLMEYDGKRVSPFYVLDRMEKDIETQRAILTEKDRELYEEVIMHSVGRIIRGRINRAERWVEKINRLMEDRNTSSGLTFSIRWRPRTAEHENEMDTKDLVELLQRDPRLYKDEDVRRVTEHFRSRVDRARAALEDKGYGETFHQIVKEILDYRKWFAFTLYYRRAGEQRKELTNNVFYKFSGGEKAMAMYIPLFSAAYSRYLDARDDAPYIISLDEAFAGVDEHNVRDMFDLMENLGFNYIINSQVLWGDYDTVSALSICELVRPRNEPYVTVIHYRWDGKVRRLLSWEGGDRRFGAEEDKEARTGTP